MLPLSPFPRQAGGTGNRKCRPRSHDCLFLDRQGVKRVIIFCSCQVEGTGHRNVSAKCAGILGNLKFLAPFTLEAAADQPSFEVTTGEEKAVVGTWPALAIPFHPCLSRKRQLWEHGVCLRLPFPLPVEETAIMGTWRALANPFSPCLLRKRQS